jgi:hypothetical protein
MAVVFFVTLPLRSVYSIAVTQNPATEIKIKHLIINILLKQ